MDGLISGLSGRDRRVTSVRVLGTSATYIYLHWSWLIYEYTCCSLTCNIRLMYIRVDPLIMTKFIQPETLAVYKF